MIAYLSKIIKINNINVVGITRNEFGENYQVLSVKKKGTKIAIVGKRYFKNFDDLKSQIDFKIPILLVVDGKGVLNKKIEYANEADLNWQKNIDYNSIYFTSFKTEQSSFISFCRKNTIVEILDDFKKNNFQLIDVYVGSFLSALLYDSIKAESILSNDLELEFENGELYGFTKKEELVLKKKYSIGGDEINNNELPLYGVLLHFFLNPDTVEKTIDSNLNAEEIIYKKAFNGLGTFLLVSFLIALLMSYLLIQYYGSKNNELNLQNVYTNQSFQKILDLEKQKDEKLKIINQSGTFSNKYLSFFAYELMKSVPGNISLDQLNIFPIGKEIKAEKKIDFESNTIRVKGTTFNENSLNKWLNDVRQNSWIGNFEIVSLKKDKNNKTLFEIKISVKNV